MVRHPRRLRLVLSAVVGLFTVAALAGCVSMPSGGPVLSYTITQGPASGQSQPYPQTYAQPPRASWGPQDIVRGFLTAAASFGPRQQIARQYLTPEENHKWNPGWGARVYRNAPDVHPAVMLGKGSKETATVTIGGSVQATLASYGGYAVASGPAAGPQTIISLQKQKIGGQWRWRISSAPPYLLLASYQFKSDYQLRNLYFFDTTTSSVLVPDPVYVPLQATAANLMGGLVSDLIHPPTDWLSKGPTPTSKGATITAFPPSTKADVTLNGGTAAINLRGPIKAANYTLLEQVSAQLLRTLIGSGESGPAVQSVEVSVNGKPWIPPNSDQNPVQQLPQSAFRPPTGASSTGTYYYLDGTGNLWSSDASQHKQKLAHIGTDFSQIAVSPDRQYVAAVRNGALFTGRVGHPLALRQGAGYTSISWDSTDNLWAISEDQIVMLASGSAGPQGKPVSVNVVASDGTTPNVGPFSALRVAPDGVRIALIVGTTDLHFGAIVVAQPGGRPAQVNREIVLSPFSVSVPGATFTAVTWFGPDNVITLRDPGPALTEYPVDGGNATSIPAQPRMSWITASSGNPLLAGLPNGYMFSDPSPLSGSWMPAARPPIISAIYPG